MYQAEAEAEREPRLLTIDFMGIGSDKLETSTTTGFQLTARRSMPSCLRKIKPHMLQQLLFPNPDQVEISEPIIKTLELFPLHTSNCKEGDIVDRQLPSITARIKFSELAAPFYNDALNVSSEKEGNGNGNGLQQICAASEKGVSSTSRGAGEGAGFTAKQCVEAPRSQLPIAKKLSLQRFLQKRKDRYCCYLLIFFREYTRDHCGSVPRILDFDYNPGAFLTRDFPTRFQSSEVLIGCVVVVILDGRRLVIFMVLSDE
ncbi:hypothetical protein KI387_001425, partial [Taxus chinensis]